MTIVDSQDLAMTVVGVLEHMAFVLAEPSQSTLSEAFTEPMLCSRIQYEDPDGKVGHVFLAGSNDFLIEVATSMLAVDPDELDQEVHCNAVIRELANIVAGEMIMKLGGETKPFHLGLPQPATMEDLTAEDGREDTTDSVVETDDGLLVVTVRDPA